MRRKKMEMGIFEEQFLMLTPVFDLDTCVKTPQKSYNPQLLFFLGREKKGV